MSLICCNNVYDPLNDHIGFTVHFEPSEGHKEQRERASRVIAYLQKLSQEQLIEESIRFFKWIVMYHTTDANLVYAEQLLDFFHSQGLLQHKQEVNNPVKQQTKRYLVIFTMNGHVFAKTYNSIRELRADTGKKPSQIKCLPTDQLFCKILKHKSTEESNIDSEP